MKICDYLISTRTYEMNLNKYINDYIIPILTKHNEEKKIKFGLTLIIKKQKKIFLIILCITSIIQIIFLFIKLYIILIIFINYIIYLL